MRSFSLLSMHSWTKLNYRWFSRPCQRESPSNESQFDWHWWFKEQWIKNNIDELGTFYFYFYLFQFCSKKEKCEKSEKSGKISLEIYFKSIEMEAS